MLYPQIKSIDLEIAKKFIQQFKYEDSPEGDITSDGIFNGDEVSKAIVLSKSESVLAGVDLIQLFFDNNTTVENLKNDGDVLKAGDEIAIIAGSTKEILKMERLFLNLLQRMCGIARNAKQMSDIAKPYNVEVLDTRKTTPGLRIFEKYAVYAGGGTNHRYDLSSGVLIKDNHIQAAGGIKESLIKIMSKVKNKPIQIEIDTFAQLEEALDNKPDAVLLDNFSPEETKKAVNIIRNHFKSKNIYIESSGGIDLTNINSYVATGIDAVSSGALTHSVKSADISLDFK
jgi:nicotinate-nucleotide pyrophosphorylase (carboxylating)